MVEKLLAKLGITTETISTETIEELDHMRVRAIVLEHQAREAWRAYANARLALMLKEQGGLQ
jgi:hypothetical protein